MMINALFAATGLAVALGMAASAGADPTIGHVTDVAVESPSMLCAIGSDDDSPGVGPNVVCQADGFPGSPVDPDSLVHLDQAVLTAAGELTYRDANIPTGGDDFNPTKLSTDRVYRIQGWTVVPTGDGITFTNDATDHGMTVTAQRGVTAF